MVGVAVSPRLRAIDFLVVKRRWHGARPILALPLKPNTHNHGPWLGIQLAICHQYRCTSIGSPLKRLENLLILFCNSLTVQSISTSTVLSPLWCPDVREYLNFIYQEKFCLLSRLSPAQFICHCCIILKDFIEWKLSWDSGFRVLSGSRHILCRQRWVSEGYHYELI